MESIVGGVCPWAAGGQAELVLGGFIQLLLASYCGLNNPNMWPKDKAPTLLNGTIPEYDFIIVGSGSSGSILARRLADEKYKVLLLEAGGDPVVESEIPGMAVSLQQSRANWEYKAVKNSNFCQGMNDQQCHIPAGKTIGGSSAINNMLYIRGNKEDFDEWENMGNSGWGFESLMKYFKKIERLQRVQNYEEISKNYGSEGLISIDSFIGHIPWSEVIKETWKEKGLKIKNDVNEVNQAGIVESFATVNGGQRWSTAKGYLNEINETSDKYLDVVKHAYVTKILVDENTKQAAGVQIKIGTRDFQVKMKKEVILAAGTLNTPQILMLSGIGPKKHLETIGIKPIIADLPVGQNLMDHVAFPVMIQVENSLGIFSREMIIQSVMKYLLQRSGPLSTVGISDLIGFVNTKDEKSSVPDVAFYHTYTPINDTLVIPDMIQGYGYSRDFSKLLVDASRDHECLFIYPTILKPKSRGKIELQSTEFKEKPLLYMEYFKEQEDMDIMLRGIRFVEQLEQTKTFQDAGLKIKELKLEACPYDFKSDEYWKCMVKYVASTAYDSVGTSKMGPKNDGSSVVDSNLRVHGIKNLRVVDASIMPSIPRAPTNAAAMMIGEKAADMIKLDWSGFRKEEL